MPWSAFLLIVGLSALLAALLLLRQWLVRRRARQETDGRGFEIFVRETKTARELVFRTVTEVVQNRELLGQPLRTDFAYIDGFHLCMAISPGAKRALFVGGGAGLGPRQFVHAYPSVSVTVVERDARVLELARRHFGLETSARLEVLQGDGREVLQTSSPGSWDVVVVDVHVGSGIPLELTTADFFRVVHQALSPSGVLCMNVLGSLEDLGRSSVRGISAQLQAVFGAGHLRVYAVPYPDEPSPVSAESPRNWLAFATIPPADWSAPELLDRAHRLDNPRTPQVSLAAAHEVTTRALGRGAG
ncbi:MAG: spermidine synthase [Myxococcaceae bacterium]